VLPRVGSTLSDDSYKELGLRTALLEESGKELAKVRIVAVLWTRINSFALKDELIGELNESLKLSLA
jgi:hypothetical protein